MNYPPNGYFPPELNDGKHIFVFGANLAARHGRGAALTAKKYWGAKNNVAEGRAGNSYAIPTKDERIKTLSLGRIRKYVENFIEYAENNPDLIFLTSRIGCGLA